MIEEHSCRSIAGEGRGGPRTNMFISAVVQAGSGSAPVRIRNLSPRGAMIESPLVLAPGSEIRLGRGGLSVRGQVVWSREGRCGLRLSPPIRVADWLAPPGNAEQARVDAAVCLIKGGAAASPMLPAGDDASPQPGVTPAELAEDLRSACTLIETLGDELVADAAVLAAHADLLQLLDIATQTVTAVAGALSPGGVADDALARLEGLRASCRQALLTRER